MVKWVVTLVLALLILGLLTPWLNRLGLGHLPGDLQIKRKRKRGVFYFPFTSVILMSLFLSLLAYLLGR